MSCYTNGLGILWKAYAGEILYKFKEEDNEINSCDFNASGLKFATGGCDTKVRIYDVN